MATPNRAALLTKIHKVLKKHYGDVPGVPEWPVMEQLLFATCLENAPFDKAEEVFLALQNNFYDWNEVRVSSTKELSEVMRSLPDPVAAATALRKSLQSVFESTYSFDLDSLKKPTLGQSVQRLEKFGVSPFVIACITQWSLGGHAIPLDRGALHALEVLGLVNEAQKKQGVVPGLERAIPKNKGVEFGGLLHKLSADMVANPYSPNLHKLLLEIAPDAKGRLPRKPTKKEEAEAAAAHAAAVAEAKAKAAAKRQAELTTMKKPTEKPAPAKSSAAKAADKDKKRPASAKPEASAKKEAASKPPAKPAPAKSAAAKKTPPVKSKPAAKQKVEAGKRKPR